MSALNLRTTRALADAIGVEPRHLHRLAHLAKNLYRLVRQTGPNGKTREFDVPRMPLKLVQRSVAELLTPLLAPPIAVGGIGGLGQYHVAAQHAGFPAGGVVDIKDCFPSISHRRIYRLFTTLGCSADVSRILTKLVTHRGRLPQGSPASPAIANLILAMLDERLRPLNSATGAVVTRYVDDVCVSGARSEVRSGVALAIRSVHSLGFRISRRKSRVVSGAEPRVVLGLGIDRWRVLVPKGYRRALRSQVRAAVHGGITEGERRCLEGKISYVDKHHSGFAQRLREELDGARQMFVRQRVSDALQTRTS